MTGVGLCLPQLGEGLDPGLLREFCVRAEEHGYTSLWVQDHFMWPLEPRRGYAGRPGAPIPQQYRSVLAPTELLAAVAGWTQSVRLGTSILVAGNHWPVPLAQRLATVDLLSGGRLSVGLGVGWSAEEHDAAGTDVTRRGARMDDFVPALLACWGDDPVEHHGPHFDVPASIIRPKPLQRPRPPLLSGMWSAAGLERTARLFDGWNPAGLPVDRVAELAAGMSAARPADLAPLTIHHRVFAQYPHAPTPEGDVVARLADEVAAAAAHGFDDVIVEHNFWSGVADPTAWLEVPERFAPLVSAARS
ncbi:MAG: TIGR03619 family F420-dependent LLM class oxidoreductase [Ilumatobacteraceae bacterium]|nr:TIGR03619 family F420-dependent LLM class oxidoreductase [Ilumatobacteraceae bacterium]